MSTYFHVKLLVTSYLCLLFVLYIDFPYQYEDQVSLVIGIVYSIYDNRCVGCVYT